MQNAPRSGAFLLSMFKYFLRAKNESKSVARGRAQKSKRSCEKTSSLNLNAVRQNFEAKKFLNQRRQNVRLFVG